MKTFLAVYIGTPESRKQSGWNDLPEEQRKQKERQGMQAWHDWIETHGASIERVGAPLGRTKRISASGTQDVHNNLTGYSLIKAESYEDAAKLFENHPHFAIFPGECVEIMECLPIPGMS